MRDDLVPNDDQVECPECRGTKTAAVSYPIISGKLPEDPPAPLCPVCRGKGSIPKTKAI